MKIIVITGQTATGKTKLALELSKKESGELINCDSRQIYKHLDIITGKDIINKEFYKYKKFKSLNIGYYLANDEVKLWLYDIVDPKQYFSSYNYQQCAFSVIKKIFAEGKTPIIVGGAYFYLKHLLYGFDYRVPPNFPLREKLNNKSVDYLQKSLISLNPQIYNNLNESDRQNPRRLIRKIEIELDILPVTPTTPMSPISPISPTIIGLCFQEKDRLSQAIEKRVEKRLKQGAIEEVERLLKMGYQETDPGLKTIGCQQIIKYLKGESTKKEAINQWITAEIQYAKRQYTFMKKDKNIKWKEISPLFPSKQF